MAVAAGGFGGLATGLGVGVGYGALSQYASLAMLTAKWKCIPRGFKIDALSATLQTIIDAEKDRVSGLSTKGAVDVIHDFIDNTINIAWMLDEGIAQQMFVQMIQQSIAYAIHASHAGSIGTITNVYSGSASLGAGKESAVNQATDQYDRLHRAILNASSGLNLPSTAAEIVGGANSRLDVYLNRVMADMQGFIGEWNDLIMGYYRRYSTLAHTRYENAVTMKEDVVTRAYALLETVGNEHLKRINELMDSMEGAYNWYEAGMCSYDELNEIVTRIELERQASEQVYDEYKTAVMQSITNAIIDWDAKITQGYNDLTDMETEWKTLLASVMSPVISDTINFASFLISVCDKAISDVCAYRNIIPPISVIQKVDFEHSGYAGEIDFAFLQYMGTIHPILQYSTLVGTPVSICSEQDDYSVPDSVDRMITRDSFGIMYAVYGKPKDGYTQIYVKTSTDGGGTWNDETLISTVAGMETEDQLAPCIAVDAVSHVHVVWSGRATGYSGMQIWYSVFDGEEWSTPERLSVLGGMDTLSQYNPCITVDWLDRPSVAWLGGCNDFPNYFQIWVARYNGSSWELPDRISTATGMDSNTQYLPSIAMDGSNYLHVTWHGKATGYSLPQIWYAKRTTSWSAPVRISTLDAMQDYEQSTACVAVNSLNHVYVTWKGCDDGVAPHYNIYYAYYDTEWHTPERVSTQPPSETDENYDPTITIDDEDNVYILWLALKIPTEIADHIYYVRLTGGLIVPTLILSGYGYAEPSFRRVRRF
jgi:hypothetical protein